MLPLQKKVLEMPSSILNEMFFLDQCELSEICTRAAQQRSSRFWNEPDIIIIIRLYLCPLQDEGCSLRSPFTPVLR